MKRNASNNMAVYVALLLGSFLIMIVGFSAKIAILEMLGLLSFPVFLIMLIPMISETKEKERLEELNQRGEKLRDLLKESGLTINKEYANGFNGIGVDLDGEKIITIKPNEDGEHQKRIIPMNKILHAELVEDGETITRTSRFDQLKGAAVGGALFGATGAVIGGLSGEKSTSEMVQKIELQLTVEDILDPIERIVFFEMKKPVEKKDEIYKTARKDAEEWYAILGRILQSDSYEGQGSVDK